MADSLLHITAVNKILADNTTAAYTSILKKNRDDFILGTIIFDLPYYENIILSGIQTLLHKPVSYCAAGQTIHNHGGRQLCIDALTTAHSDSQFAIAAGMFSHYALDIIFHKKIEQLIHSSDADNATHELIENQIGLHCHYHLLGHAGVGNSYSSKTLNISPSPGWDIFYGHIVSNVTNLKLTPAYLQKCLRSLRLFGQLNSFSFAPWVKTTAPDNSEFIKMSIDLLNTALPPAAQFINSAFNAYTGKISPAELLAAVPDRKMNNGDYEN